MDKEVKQEESLREAEENCRVILTKRVAKTLADGDKSYEAIGRLVAQYAREMVGYPVKARTLAQQARRMDAAKKPKKEICDSVTTPEESKVDHTAEEDTNDLASMRVKYNTIKDKLRMAQQEIQSSTGINERLRIENSHLQQGNEQIQKAETPAAVAEEPKGPEPAKFKDRFKINPMTEKVCEGLIKEWDSLSSEEPAFHQTTAMRILLKRMTQKEKELFLGIIYDSGAVGGKKSKLNTMIDLWEFLTKKNKNKFLDWIKNDYEVAGQDMIKLREKIHDLEDTISGMQEYINEPEQEKREDELGIPLEVSEEGGN